MKKSFFTLILFSTILNVNAFDNSFKGFIWGIETSPTLNLYNYPDYQKDESLNADFLVKGQMIFGGGFTEWLAFYGSYNVYSRFYKSIKFRTNPLLGLKFKNSNWIYDVGGWFTKDMAVINFSSSYLFKNRFRVGLDFCFKSEDKANHPDGFKSDKSDVVYVFPIGIRLGLLFF